jgi:hypothetical protein
VRRRDRYVFYDINARGDRGQFYRPILRDCEPALSKPGGLGSHHSRFSIAMDLSDARFSADQRLMMRYCECRFIGDVLFRPRGFRHLSVMRALKRSIS